MEPVSVAHELGKMMLSATLPRADYRGSIVKDQDIRKPNMVACLLTTFRGVTRPKGQDGSEKRGKRADGVLQVSEQVALICVLQS